jgi:hypothetical protein
VSRDLHRELRPQIRRPRAPQALRFCCRDRRSRARHHLLPAFGTPSKISISCFSAHSLAPASSSSQILRRVPTLVNRWRPRARGSARHLCRAPPRAALGVEHLDGRAPGQPAREAEYLAGVERQHGEQRPRARRRKRGPPPRGRVHDVESRRPGRVVE